MELHAQGDVEEMEVEQAGPSTGKAVAKPSGKRFEIKKWNAVAMWSWAICTDTCAICRNNLYEPSIEYQVHQYDTGDSHHAPSLLNARSDVSKPSQKVLPDCWH